MGYLKDKLVKRKKLLKVSTSHVLIIPNNWINEMNWDRTMILNMVWFPNENKIEITETGEREEKNEEAGNSITV